MSKILDTKFGNVVILEWNIEKDKIKVLIDKDITATFNGVELFQDFTIVRNSDRERFSDRSDEQIKLAKYNEEKAKFMK